MTDFFDQTISSIMEDRPFEEEEQEESLSLE